MTTFKLKPPTHTELVNRLKTTQSGTWQGYNYQAEWQHDDNEWWLTSEDFGPSGNAWLDWNSSLTRHLNRFYDNESNPGPVWLSMTSSCS
jgi:hypothetical protein